MDVHQLILSRVAPDALAKGLNNVFVSELDEVRERLSEAKSAFFKLQEVERAVAQLQEGKGDRRRSESLMKLVEETKDVDQKLRNEINHFRAVLKGEKLDEDKLIKANEKADVIESEDQLSSAKSLEEEMTADIALQTQAFLESIKDSELSDSNACNIGGERFRKLVNYISSECVGVCDPLTVTQAVVESLNAYAKRLESAKLSISNLDPLLGQIRAIEEFLLVVPTSTTALGSGRVKLYIKLRGLKRGLNPTSVCLQHALAFDLLGGLERFDHIEDMAIEIKAALFSDQLTHSVFYEISTAVRLVLNWIDELPMDLHTAKSVATIVYFRDTITSSAEAIISVRKRTIMWSQKLAKHVARAGKVLASVAKTKAISYKSKYPDSYLVMELANSIQLLSADEQAKQLDILIDSLEELFGHSSPILLLNDAQLIHTFETAATFMLQASTDSSKVERYKQFCRTARKFVHQIPWQHFKTVMNSALYALSTALELHVESCAQARMQTPFIRPKSVTGRIQGCSRAMDALLTCDWVPTTQFDEKIHLIGWLLQACGTACMWNARTDPYILETVLKFRKCIAKMPAHEQPMRVVTVRKMEKLIKDMSGGAV